MNIENIDKTIAIMERSKASNSSNLDNCKTDGSDNVCLARDIALSPEWIEFGGTADQRGQPIHPDTSRDEKAIARWWGTSTALAASFIYGDRCIYPDVWYRLRAEHVIEKLQELKTLGEQDFLKKYAF